MPFEKKKTEKKYEFHLVSHLPPFPLAGVCVCVCVRAKEGDTRETKGILASFRHFGGGWGDGGWGWGWGVSSAIRCI